MFDVLQAVFWSLTYIFLIVYAIKYKKHGIPLVAICLNYAWETVSLTQSILNGAQTALIIHITWFLLDTVIVALFLFHETSIFQNQRDKLVFLVSYAASIIFLAALFKSGGMLVSCFAIDLIMAIAFLAFAFGKEMVFSLISISIGITKLIGDLFAWLYYRYESIVDLIGIIVLLCNIAYILILLYKYFNKIKNKNRQEDEI